MLGNVHDASLLTLASSITYGSGHCRGAAPSAFLVFELGLASTACHSTRTATRAAVTIYWAKPILNRLFWLWTLVRSRGDVDAVGPGRLVSHAHVVLLASVSDHTRCNIKG